MSDIIDDAIEAVVCGMVATAGAGLLGVIAVIIASLWSLGGSGAAFSILLIGCLFLVPLAVFAGLRGWIAR